MSAWRVRSRPAGAGDHRRQGQQAWRKRVVERRRAAKVGVRPSANAVGPAEEERQQEVNQRTRIGRRLDQRKRVVTPEAAVRAGQEARSSRPAAAPRPACRARAPRDGARPGECRAHAARPSTTAQPSAIAAISGSPASSSSAQMPPKRGERAARRLAVARREQCRRQRRRQRHPGDRVVEIHLRQEVARRREADRRGPGAFAPEPPAAAEPVHRGQRHDRVQPEVGIELPERRARRRAAGCRDRAAARSDCRAAPARRRATDRSAAARGSAARWRDRHGARDGC